MLTIHLDSVYMKVPFKPLMKLNVQAYEQQFQTKMFHHRGYCSQLNETIEIRRIGNLTRTSKKDDTLRLTAYQMVNGREQPCGRLELRFKDLGRGLQMQRLLECQDKEAAIIFTAQIEEISDD